MLIYKNLRKNMLYYIDKFNLISLKGKGFTDFLINPTKIAEYCIISLELRAIEYTLSNFS